MNKWFSDLYKTVVNFNQWFSYGQAWMNIPFRVLQVSSSISILLIFFGAEQSTVLLLLLSGVLLAGSLWLGFVLFKVRGRTIDSFIQGWQNPIGNIFAVGRDFSHIQLAIHFDIPFPEQLREWGLTGWSDYIKVLEYSLYLGEKARAKPVCQEFFKEALKT